MLMEAANPHLANNWRPAHASDLQRINEIADTIHVDLPERPEVIAEKLALSGGGCFVLVRDGHTVGYGLSHPWLLYEIPPLDTFLGSTPITPDCIFIHDVAVLPDARRQGAAGAYVGLISAIAQQQRISSLSLVSVYNTHPLWERYGFRIEDTPKIRSKLTAYGDTARYMISRLE